MCRDPCAATFWAAILPAASLGQTIWFYQHFAPVVAPSLLFARDSDSEIHTVTSVPDVLRTVVFTSSLTQGQPRNRAQIARATVI